MRAAAGTGGLFQLLLPPLHPPRAKFLCAENPFPSVFSPSGSFLAVRGRVGAPRASVPWEHPALDSALLWGEWGRSWPEAAVPRAAWGSAAFLCVAPGLIV